MPTASARRPRPFFLMVKVMAVLAMVLPAASSAAAAEVPHVLVYSGTQGYRHASIAYGNPIIKAIADRTGAFTVDFTEDPADIVPSNLADYDMVLFNSPSGPRATLATDRPAGTCETAATGYAACDHAPFTQAQREGFTQWLGCGGGVVGVHQVMDAWHDWPEWDELTGMVFESHHANAEAEMFVLSDHPAAAPFGTIEFEGDTVIGDRFVHADEFYDYAPGNGPTSLSSDVVPLLGIGAFTNPSVEANQGRFYDHEQPMAWLSSFGGANRSFMTNLGHNNSTWAKPQFQAHLLEGISYVGGMRPDADCVSEIEDPPFVWPSLGCAPAPAAAVCPFVYVYGVNPDQR